MLRIVLLVLGLTSVVHHPILWIDHVLWDEVSFEKMAAGGDLSGKLSSLADQGVATNYWVYVVLSWFPNPTWVLRLAAFLSIWSCASLIALGLHRLAGLTRRAAVAAAAVAIAYPAFQMYANAGASIYVIALALFIAGCASYLAALAGGPGAARLWFAAAAGFWVLGFMQQWLLVTYYAFFTAVAVCRPVHWWRDRWRAAPDRRALLRIHLVLLAAPLVVFFSQRRLFPLNPYFAGYSEVKIQWARLAGGSIRALRAGVAHPFENLGELPPAFWPFAAVAAAILGGALARRRGPAAEPAPAVHGGRLVLAGLVALAGGLVPFILTGKPFALEGPETRFAIAVGFALAFVAAGGLAALQRRGNRRTSAVLAAAGAFILLGFAALHTRNYINWQAAAIKDHAVVESLRRMPPPPGVNFFMVEGDPVEHGYERRHYDWASLLERAWGGDLRLAEVAARVQPLLRHYYTPVGLSRDTALDFRTWMGYGTPGPPDDWCTLRFETSADMDFRRTGTWRVVLSDALHRLGLKSESRQAWLRHFITDVRISPPRRHPQSSAGLDRIDPSWDMSREWRTLQGAATLAGGGAFSLESTAGQAGRFSLMPLPGGGFALRCDAIPERGPARIDLRLRPRPGAPRPAGSFGMTCEYETLGDAQPPQLVLVSNPYAETAALPRQRDLPIIEAWIADPLEYGLLIWKPRSPGEIVRVRGLTAGFVAP